MRVVIDRIENDRAVVELPDGQMMQLPAALFPHAAEGDVYTIEKDPSETDERRRRIENKMSKLFWDERGEVSH